MMAMILEILTHKIEPDITVADLIGRMSLGNQLMRAEDELKKVIEGGTKKLILDVHQLSYVDSAAIGVLVMLFGTMAKNGGQLRLAAPGEVLKKVFAITQLQRIIPIDSDVATASKSFT